MQYHKVYKDNYEFKSVTQGENVVNKMKLHRLWFNYEMILWMGNMQ
jgi:hypothetical protein